MPEVRRTQAQRRAETSKALIDAAIETIVDKGYAQVTVKEVCRRAGVSHGGLFGRFPTLFDLVAAAAAEVGKRQRESFVAKMNQLPDRSDLTEVLSLWRSAARDPINAVWLELTMAARTDPALREKLEVVRLEYAAALVTGGVKMPSARGLSVEQVLALGSIVVFCFDGDALSTGAFPQPEQDAARMAVFSEMVGHYLAAHRGPA
ncbi:TetR/AcrR family transcriptional regulator [Nocardia sp. NPDC059177]|uniref:TetR/AcrR family transcriptional regulator n=1 Tax=Nocardia sp. NPDC059177 TaxID=3346759 RepID=UPI0036958107